MNFKILLDVLISEDVYNKIKNNESELFDLIPELKECHGFDQKNRWHIYDVYEHILHVVAGVRSNKCLRIAALFHDMGKPLSYSEDENMVGHFYNHWNKSVDIFKKYQNMFELSFDEGLLIENLIFYHDLNIEKVSVEKLREIINDIGVENINLLFELKRADLLAQSPEFHSLISNINSQEQMMLTLEK